MNGWDELVGTSSNDLTALQMAVRAAIIFLYAVALYRLLPRKSLGGSSVIDIVVMVIVASSLSRALTGNAPLLPTLAATAVLSGLYYALSVAARHVELISLVTKGRPVEVIRDGVIDERALRRVQMGSRDLEQNLRLSGIEDAREVARACVERNGEVSVIRKR